MMAMAAFSVKLLSQKLYTTVFGFCFRTNPNILLRIKNLSNNDVLRIRCTYAANLQSKTQVNAGIHYSQEGDIDSGSEVVKRKQPLQMSMIYEKLSNNPFMSEDDIHLFRNEVITSGNTVNETNIDAIIIGVCASLKNQEFAEFYINALERRNIEINTATMGKYLKLCYACNIKDNSKVLQICHKIREKLPLMDASTAENVIYGLSLTTEWKQALDLINMIKETCKPTASSYSAIIIAAFKNEAQDLGWELMEECIKEDRTPLDAVYFAWLDLYCTVNNSSNYDSALEKVEKLLNFFRHHELHPSSQVSRKLKYIFEGMNWKGKFTPISESGVCNSCRAGMPPIFISRSEFDVLSKTFLEKVLVGPDVFAKSLPEEVEDFRNLIANEAPYNTVIDGLNVGYSAGAGGKVPPHRCAALLQAVVAHFVDLSHKILVIGRTHMNSWPQREMDYIRQNSHLLLIQNLSQDDPFLLYATMSSGIGTCFLSRDLMRSHAYRLKMADPSLSSLFKRWQISHQMRLVGVSSNRRVDIKLPLEYSPNVQKVDGNWHIPCHDEMDDENGAVASEEKKSTPFTISHLDAPKYWLCFSRKQFRERPKKYIVNKRNFY